LYDLEIKTYTPFKKTISKRDYPPSVFDYNIECDVYICPNGCELKYTSISNKERRKIYSASLKDCKKCPKRCECVGGTDIRAKTIHISFFKDIVDNQRANYGTKRYYEIQRKRRIYCEGNFALQKDNHNLRRTRKRGNERVTEHCLCSALALNLKRLVRHLKSEIFQKYLFDYVHFL
jgi:hypothetical protein